MIENKYEAAFHFQSNQNGLSGPKGNKNIICTVVTFYDRHMALTTAAVKSNKKPWIQRTHIKNENRRLGFIKSLHMQLQSNLNGSNTDGSFTMANSNSFFSPNEILPITQENKYLGKFSLLS